LNSDLLFQPQSAITLAAVVSLIESN